MAHYVYVRCRNRQSIAKIKVLSKMHHCARAIANICMNVLSEYVSQNLPSHVKIGGRPHEIK